MSERARVLTRAASAADADAIGRLMSAFNALVGVMGFPGPGDPDPAATIVSIEQAVRRMAAMQATESIYVAEVQGQVVGLAALRVVPHLDQDVPYGELTQLYVDPSFRRSGVGDALLEQVEQQAAARGCTAVYLLTDMDNHNAQAFYRSEGYHMHCVGFVKSLGVQS